MVKIYGIKNKKIAKKYFKKRTTRSVKASYVNKPLVSLGQGFPKKMNATLKYKDYALIQSTSGVMYNYSFCANGIWKPNLTGTTHQPMFSDQLFAIYNHAHVASSRIKVTFLPANANTVPVAVGVYLNDDVSAPTTSYITYGEQTLTKMKIIGNTTADDREIIKASFSSSKMFGGSLLANNSLINTASANPTEITAYSLFVQSMDLTATTNVYCLVEIEYNCIFTELKDFSGS